MLAGTETKRNLKYHLTFIRRNKPKGKKTNIYRVIKLQSGKPNMHLGVIKWNGAFRKYWFEPINNTGWSDDCLDLVSAFLKKVNRRWRNKIQKRKSKNGI